ncbi:glycine--tRNA ligase subunit beta [Inhella gelatinilytica]|uniref:Glycine--tRNA ligase beta subunit n=1 Tax=Inhella gelatinilytica TaxID=2795030 RepID=A0A931ISF5_9BURK|nr:glycine--tRNA ligase subunit beta [Inhella gelatinilytica]MBH9551289.1 glycine--tRNA ligase subunit beta [Inhella gelatinilytica]
MSTTQNLLVELFVEELPPKALKKLGESFAQLIETALRAQGLVAEGAVATSFASPRRLGLHLTQVLEQAPEKALRIKLMPVAVGLAADGQPSPALLKKLAASGLAADTPLERALDGKAEALFANTVQPGASLAQGLQQALDEMLKALPIPKVMSYQLADGWSNVHFVRPAHSLIALHGDTVVPVSLLGLQSGRHTQGHRFEAAEPRLEIEHADHYAEALRTRGAVIASFVERRAELQRQLQAAGAKLGLKPIDDEALLDEVTALVERPNVLHCQFEKEFLEVPQECLILTMKANQKYFPLLDVSKGNEGKLTQHFLVVSNIAPADASAVIQGNERVVRPRLADAKFFYDQDRKKKLADRVPGLAKVVYHGKLGSQGERAERVRAIAHAIVNQLRMATVPYTVEARDEFEVLDSKVQQAAQLAKADLLTDMVGEFPELQGIMGGYYARHEGLRDGVAIAIEDHYKPRFAGDALPRNHTGTVLALADKLETLVGLFGIGQLPSGDKDPFALRRHALGVIRILMEKNLPLSLPALVQAGVAAFPDGMLTHATVQDDLLHFAYERLTGALRDQGYSAQEVDAVIALRPTQWGDIPKRLAAVRAFAALPEAPALAAANKRVGNILKKSEEAPVALNAALLQEAAEQQLAAALQAATAQADPLFEQGDFTGSLRALAALKAPVDAFFDAVMVNAEDLAVRANRLALLRSLQQAMNRVAELARLAQ